MEQVYRNAITNDIDINLDDLELEDLDDILGNSRTGINLKINSSKKEKQIE